MADDAERIAAILEGSLAPDEAAILAKRIDTDPEFRALLAQHLLVARALPLVVHDADSRAADTAERVGNLIRHNRPSQRFASAERIRSRIRRRQQQQRHGSIGRWWWIGGGLATAASIVVAWRVLDTPPATETPRRDGAAEIAAGPGAGSLVRLGDTIAAPVHEGLRLRLLDVADGQIDLLPGTRLHCDAADGLPVWRLESGTLHCALAHRPAERTAAFVAGPWTYRIVGTQFALRRHEGINDLRVDQGIVAVRGPTGSEAQIGASTTHRSDDRGLGVERRERPTAIIDDFDFPSSISWMVNHNTASSAAMRWVDSEDGPGRHLRIEAQLRPDKAMGMHVQVFGALPGEHLPLGITPQGLAVRWRCQAQGNLRLVVLEGQAPEYFSAVIPPTSAGWTTAELPWDRFQRHHFQVAGAGQDGLDPRTLHAVAIEFAPKDPSRGTYAVQLDLDDLRWLGIPASGQRTE
jgi:hypothetical protein